MLTIQDVAKRMDGREYGGELPANEALELKAAGIVVVYGQSDDLCEFAGAISNDIDCTANRAIYLDRNGLACSVEVAEQLGVRGWERYKVCAAKIQAEWCKTPDGPSWTYGTAIPHETFRIMEDGEVYCVGIVFLLSDLPVVEL